MIDLKPACGQMIEVVSRIAIERLADPTPCTEAVARTMGSSANIRQRSIGIKRS
jgi:hypothetical protein